MNLPAIEHAAQAQTLLVLGAFHPQPDDGAPTGIRTLVLLGPAEPAFWPAFTQTAEYQDGAPDPMDRWSRRVVTKLATDLGAAPFFPFGGPPYMPFYSWALKTGRCHVSPIQFLVHDTAGLFVSFRGALGFGQKLDLSAPPPSPCEDCSGKPCQIACPVSALTAEQYDVDACKTHIRDQDSGRCRDTGCAARRACPVSQRFGRLPEQSRFHMTTFIDP